MELEAICQDIIQIIDEIIGIIQLPGTGVTWSGYETVEEAIGELTAHRNRLIETDLSKLDKLKMLFLPTGPLQEIAVSSGWDKSFLALAERFDAAMIRVHSKTHL